MSNTDSKIRTICEEIGNIEYLNNRVYDLPNIRIYGTTLWSDISDKVSRNMNDCRCIRVNNETMLDADHTRKLHKHAVDVLEQEINRNNKPILVLTHHCPSHEMNGTKYANSPNISGFSTDLTHLFCYPVVGWICGHSHVTMQTKINGIPCVSNCVGYPGERTLYQMDNILRIDIKPE